VLTLLFAAGVLYRVPQDDGELPALIRALDAIPAEDLARHIAQQPAVRRLIVLQSRGTTGIVQYLEKSTHWPGKLAACVVLRETGHRNELSLAAEDANPLVRNFARASLGTRPLPPGDDCRAPEPYEIDERTLMSLSTLLDAAVDLSKDERRQWLRSLAADAAIYHDVQFGDTPQTIARQLLKDRPIELAEYVVESLNREGTTESNARCLEALGEVIAVTYGVSQRGEFPTKDALHRLLAPLLDGTISPGSDAARIEVARLKLCLLPLSQSALLEAELLSSTDEQLRRMASYMFNATEQHLLVNGDEEQLKALLAKMQAATDRESDDSHKTWMRIQLEGAVENSEKVWRKVRQGMAIYDESGRVVEVVHYVSVDGALVDVDEDEYQLMVKAVGRPYMTDDVFTRLRKQCLAMKTIKNAAHGPPVRGTEASLDIGSDPPESGEADASSRAAPTRGAAPTVIAVLALVLLTVVLCHAIRSRKVTP
jgi:hypothetical protein